MTNQYTPVNALENLVEELFLKGGMDPEKAATTARYLVLTDMMGRPTHGVSQVWNYLNELSSGGMLGEGAPEILRDLGGTLVLDGGYRPGLWLVDHALHIGFARVEKQGSVIIAMRKSHHIGCLAALAKTATDRGLFVMLASSGPHTKAAAPFGGKEALFSPNPLAIGFPTSNAPVLIDMTATLTTISNVRENVAAGTKLQGQYLLDHEGNATDDPNILEKNQPKGSMLLLGGMEAGHKGFGLALMVEALTQGFSGHGRLDGVKRWGASVFIQLIDPEALAGREAFTAQMDYFAQECHRNEPLDQNKPVRLPGEQACRLIEVAKQRGILLSPAARNSLRLAAERYSLTLKYSNVLA